MKHYYLPLNFIVNSLKLTIEIDSKLGFEPTKIHQLRDQESELISQQNKFNQQLNHMRRELGI